jgi:hypothetical protein
VIQHKSTELTTITTMESVNIDKRDSPVQAAEFGTSFCEKLNNTRH